MASGTIWLVCFGLFYLTSHAYIIKPTETLTNVQKTGRCYENGRWYEDGEIVYKHKCGGMKCDDGFLMIWDDKCAFGTEETVKTTPPTTISSGRCYENGRWYEDGEIVYKHKCGGMKCDDGFLMIWDDKCAFGTEETVTTTPPTTISSGRCYENGRWYEDGEIVYKHKCGGMKCDDGFLMIWDDKCAFGTEETVTTTPPTTISSGRCYENGRWYEDGEIVYKHKCGGMKCDDGFLMIWDDKCAFGTEETVTTTPPTTISSGRCYENGRWYEDGEIVYKHKCGGMKCDDGFLMIWDDKCAFGTEETVATTPPTTVSAGRCYENGRWYMNGEIVYKNKCGGMKCDDGVMMIWDNQCA